MASHLLVRRNKTLHTLLVTEGTQKPPDERWADLIRWPESALEFLFLSASDKMFMSDIMYKRLQWSRGSVLAFGTQVRGFKPGRNRRIFRAKKSSVRLPSEGK